MSDTVIQVEHLGKMYRIGARQNHQDTLREALVGSLKAPLHSLLRIGQRVSEEEIIWALKDVSFEVQRGEVVGIIGRNGAGKSTLLKILSRITEPTEGRAIINGRVGSLLEVGTGFHPELTGRENIYLNGAILGMKRAEIERKFDEIVAFADLEKFIDTPVKRYSSGMYVRLAFAVAAHLEPEIMVVDEVLAVGDAQFQKKCLGKMGELANEGRTVLFVSHNMGAISQLCTRGILLEDGGLKYDGTPAEAVKLNVRESKQNQPRNLEWVAPDHSYPLGDMLHIRRYSIVDEAGIIVAAELFNSKAYSMKVELDILRPSHDIRVAFAIYSEDQTPVLSSSANDSGQIDFGNVQPGTRQFVIPLPCNLLSAGTYAIELLCLVEGQSWILPVGNESRLEFTLSRDYEPNRFWANRLGGFNAPVTTVLEWTCPESLHSTST